MRSTRDRNRVYVETAPYERSHGKAPRGEGYWAFCLVDPRRDDYLSHVVFQSGPYGVAKKAAVLEARRRGVEVLYVCS